MIVDQVCCEHLYVPINGSLVAGLETPKEAKIIRAQLEIDLLYQVVDHLGRGVTPLTGYAEGNACDQGLESPDKFHPCGVLSRLQAREDKFMRSNSRVIHGL